MGPTIHAGAHSRGLHMFGPDAAVPRAILPDRFLPKRREVAMRCLPVPCSLLVLALIMGCVTGRAEARRADATPDAAASSLPPGPSGIFFGLPGEETDGRLPGAFLPAEWWHPEPAESPKPGEVTLVGRSVRRGAGSATRRPPPSLNPSPRPEHLRYWTRRPPDPRVLAQARQLYQQKLAEAQARYPNSTGWGHSHA